MTRKDTRQSSSGSRAKSTRHTMRRSSRTERLEIVLMINAAAETMKGILAVAEDLNWNILSLNVFDGMIPPGVTPAGGIVSFLLDDQGQKHLLEMGFPLVRLGRLPHPLDSQGSTVLPDFAAAGHLAATHFAERGFHTLGFVGYRGNEAASTMWDGFNEKAKELGCAAHLLELGHDSKTGRDRQQYRSRLFQDWLTSWPRPFAVFSYSDLHAVGLCTACRAAGLQVPEDVAILGYGNNYNACMLTPVKLSSIDPNAERIGREAARLLQRLLEGESHTGVPVIVPPKAVIQRHSTDLLAVAHPAVAKALRYIWDHFDLPISVPEIAAHAGVSRRGLDSAFRQHLGRTVNGEVVRKRLERCTELLLDSDLPVGEIARITGFPTRTHLYRTFCRKFGMPPRQFRLRKGQTDARD